MVVYDEYKYNKNCMGQWIERQLSESIVNAAI